MGAQTHPISLPKGGILNSISYGNFGRFFIKPPFLREGLRVGFYSHHNLCLRLQQLTLSTVGIFL